MKLRGGVAALFLDAALVLVLAAPCCSAQSGTLVPCVCLSVDLMDARRFPSDSERSGCCARREG